MSSVTDTPIFFWKAVIKEASVAALIALGLSLLMIGVRPIDQAGGLGLSTRWDWVVIAVLSVFTGRFLLASYWQLRRQQYFSFPSVSLNIPRPLFRIANLFIALMFIVLAFALPFFSFVDRYVLDIATLVLTYIMLGWGLNIVVGLAGLLDLGYVGFYAVGAYSFALLSTHFGLSFWMCLPLAGIFGGLFGILLGYPVLRLRGDYLAIVTLGFGEIIRVVLLNWYQFTGGPNGVSDIPRPSFFGLEFTRTPEEGMYAFHTFFNLEFSPLHRIIFLYYVILCMALLTNFFTLRTRKLPIGRAWEALREDEIACRSLGMNPTNIKLTAFGIGAMFGGFAGAFFATRQGFISPESFSFVESALILAIVVLGGMGRQMGVVIAAIILIGLTEFFRELQEYRMLAFGGGMVLIMVWRPRGLLSHRDPTILLHGRYTNTQTEQG
ncbi:high-affinity branched-chain amino acid ABC transporter permease LivM [Beggiatoa leptomitoformis]|uniref:High-affinity branched-chain amino acid ABC transporter permease LivM n=1 Tax=Beggiatoa leptomitoformis TaxID=288004 RepID=A0A2N9YGC7_9GAMM|nr:high-affinity branched-chain amino acid ABC transporter permease LivM [Beggiatoa leptomitoformis]ALG68156.1 high-affinity branched-chain amino acid ABC transporter permease LivM [Beggiatoa leptomitoformis]AUI69547.1 high-affinity branched-chain amino acid ABC transporter permease LivM [Beggiatoa leptomitoformis]